MSTTPVEVSDELFDRLRTFLSPAQLLELTAGNAWENYRARFNHALGIESMGFAREPAGGVSTRNAAFAE